MAKLKDKVAIVTGGAGGIGRTICVAMAQEGAQVIVNFCKNGKGAEDLVNKIQNNGNVALAMKADLTRIDEVEAMVDSVYQRFERIDILVNNAGIIRDMLLLEMEEEDWLSVINVNLGGVYRCTKAVVKYMILHKSGRIINVSSIAAEKGGRGNCNYASAKGGINAFNKSMAVELAPKGISVNAVAPGVIVTDMSKDVRRRAKDKILSLIPMGRFGKPEEVANVVVFLASDSASYITGEVIHVTGGMGV
jgi:3-oxoacyl-[acyl-carrier protein] reductase